MNLHRPLVYRLKPVVLVALLTCAALSPARADILALDWAHLSAAYQSGATNAGTTQNFTVGANTVSTVFGYQGAATSSVFILSTPTVATYGTGASPASYANGGVSDGTLALQIGIAIPDTTTEGIVFTINFAQAVYGVSFKLFDVDYANNSFTDQIHDIVGVSGAGTVLPTLTGSASNAVGSDANNLAAGFRNSVTGSASNAQNAAGGNVSVSFSNTVPITSVSFIYGDNQNSSLGPVAPASTTQQLVALSNIVWATNPGEQVPEPGMFGVTGLGLAAMLAVTLRRRP